MVTQAFRHLRAERAKGTCQVIAASRQAGDDIAKHILARQQADISVLLKMVVYFSVSGLWHAQQKNRLL
jgi:hypothetical protein